MTLLCSELDRKTNAQIAVVTTNSLEGTPVGDYARLLFNDWGIGHKEDNRGMLILLSLTDRKYFISVGRGFEALFPNDRLSSIGRKMVPDLKQQHYSQAVLSSALEIADIIAKDRKVALHSAAELHRLARKRWSPGWLVATLPPPSPTSSSDTV